MHVVQWIQTCPACATRKSPSQRNHAPLQTVTSGFPRAARNSLCVVLMDLNYVLNYMALITHTKNSVTIITIIIITVTLSNIIMGSIRPFSHSFN